MSSELNAIENDFENAGKDIRNRIGNIASKVRAEAQDAKAALGNTLEHHREYAAGTLTKAGHRAKRLSRRYPLQIFAGALALGFVIGRLRR